MATIYVRLDPRKLKNPDADLRYALPDRIRDKSGGEFEDDGYDYVGGVPFLLLFLKTDDVDQGLLSVLSVLEHDVSDNDLLQASVVAIEHNGQTVVKYPVNFEGPFPL